MFNKTLTTMQRINKINGYVYLVEGEKQGFETFHNLGKDPDYWEKKEKDEKPKKVKTKKEED